MKNDNKLGNPRATERAYAELQYAYDFFNLHLFGGELPDCLITFQRGKNTMGYYSNKRFISSTSEEYMDEIALNPEYFPTFPLIEVMQTLVHEQCHCWQFHFGKPARKGYHNREWSNKMIMVGLMPSSTGKEGGDLVGNKMNDYPIPNGPFQKVTLELFQSGFALSWFDRYPVRPTASPKDLSPIIEQWKDTLQNAKLGQKEIQANMVLDNLLSLALHAPFVEDHSDGLTNIVFIEKVKTRHKYQCPCLDAVWGKPGLDIYCGKCKCKYKDLDV